jgi:hypothetical protein
MNTDADPSICGTTGGKIRPAYIPGGVVAGRRTPGGVGGPRFGRARRGMVAGFEQPDAQAGLVLVDPAEAGAPA